MVEQGSGEEELGGVVVAKLPCCESPELLVSPYVRDCLDGKEVLCVCYADDDGGCYQPEH